MKITTEEVESVAMLARLKFTSEEVERFTTDMGQMLEYVDKLSELNTEGVEPTAHVHDIVNAFRADEVRQGLSNEKALANAPDSEDGSFKVAKIIEEA